MLKNKLFFVEAKIDNFYLSKYNSRISILPRLSRHIYYSDKSKVLQLKRKKKSYVTLLKPINFELLTAFYTVVTLGSVSKAARQLCVTQPAISLSLRKIEKGTGLLLFRHLTNKKQIILTDYGSILFNHIQRLFYIIEESLEFSKSNFSSIQKNNSFQSNSKNLTLFYAPNLNHERLFYSIKKGVLFNSLLKNYLINLNQQNFRYFENESKFIFTKENFINLEKFYISDYKDSSDTYLYFDKFSSVKNFNNRVLFSLNNLNVVEIQTNIAFKLCLQMKVSNIFYWGSEL